MNSRSPSSLNSAKPFLPDTIAAIATPVGEGGLGVIRLSGPHAVPALKALWQGRSLEKFSSHHLYLGNFLHPQTREKLETGLAVWMQAPNSYTGEDVVELQLHGSPLLLQQILELLLQQGLRLAEPGEFTRRAFLNGKMDLLQAEGVGEMIHAKSEAALRNANAQLQGRLSDQVTDLRQKVLIMLARVEAAIDFPEEDIELILPHQTLQEIAAIERVLQDWLKKFQLGRLLREGVRLALVGRPNVGKSSLLNHLLGEERAIVHASPGTTRDVVEGWLQMEGIGFQIFDTAGIREAENAVEKEGILRSKRIAEQADLTLWLIDALQPFNEEDRAIGDQLQGRVLILANKVDLQPPTQDLMKLQAQQLAFPWPCLSISAHTGQGIAELKSAILREVGLQALGDQSYAYLNNARHREALRLSSEALARATQAFSQQMPAECMAQDLRQAAEALGALLGEFRTDDILDKIFSEFCIGK